MSQYDFDQDQVEFKESYAHYRHLEQERSRHLKFFLVMVGALFGFLGFLVKVDQPVTNWAWFLFVCGLVIVFLQILGTVTFIAIRRVGDAHAQHAKTIRYLRGKLSSDRYVSELWEAFERRAHVSVQYAAEITLHLFAFFFVAAASVGAIYALYSKVVLCWQGALVLALTLVSAVVHLGVSVWLKAPKGDTT
ncbi:hypothetical protein WDW89_23450 [Deltaproteobacteria bacterium TL4]